MKSQVKQIIEEMRNKAEYFRGDTLCSLSESFANESIAKELEMWADKLTAIIPKHK